MPLKMYWTILSKPFKTLDEAKHFRYVMVKENGINHKMMPIIEIDGRYRVLRKIYERELDKFCRENERLTIYLSDAERCRRSDDYEKYLRDMTKKTQKMLKQVKWRYL